MSDTVKRKRISGKKLTLIILSSFLAALILAVGLFFGIASCTSSKRVIPELKQGTTVRKAAPADGSTPADHTGVDNLAYMAYVLDNQPYYHAYANNSTKSTGYEQITQTWKEYKSADASGYGSSVMVCSDLSYSSLVKSSVQTCFVGDNDAYMRTGNKPAKNSTPSDIVWSEEQPAYYTEENYRGKHGEFSTELTVYVLNEDTVASCGEVIDNGDGTFTQKFSLKEDAAVWYRNKMKTNGSLKTLPTFEKIEISFTFDGKWQVLSSYCEEKASIAPSALGGIAMPSTSKTTTEFTYGEDSVDGAHYACFDKYYKNYVGKELTDKPKPVSQPTLIEVLGSAFNQVIDPNGNGQQLNLELTLGGTEYAGRLYAKVGDLDDVFGSLDVRLGLGKKDSGKQDLFVQYSNGAVNVYYSEEFALVADISRVAEEVTSITKWINNLKAGTKAEELAYALSGETEEGGLDLNALLAAIKFTYDDTSACIALDSDDLLGLGIGVKASINFTRTKAEDGDTYSFIDLKLGSLTYKSEPINLGIGITPCESTEVISRNESETAADLADYIGGISGLLNSNVYLLNLNLDGSSEIEYISGAVLDATAKLKLENGYNLISVEVPVYVSYRGLSVTLEAFYTINLENGDLGEVYLYLSDISGKPVDAKVYCNIEETVDAVKKLIALFNSDKTEGEDGDEGNDGEEEVQLLSEDGETEEVNTVAKIINAVLNADYAKIVKKLVANKTQISVTLDADEILSAFKFSSEEIKLGDLTLTLTDGAKATLSGSLESLGLSLTVSGSDDPDDDIASYDKDDYADLTVYVNGVYNLLNSNVIFVQLNLDGSGELEYISGAVLDATAKLKLENGYNLISVEVPLSVSCNGLSVNIQAFYTINLENGDLGEVYLNIAEINGETYGLKVYGNIEETVEAIKQLIALINSDKDNGEDGDEGNNGEEEVQLLSEDGETAEVNTVANIINAVLGIDYAAVIKEVVANKSQISITVDADEILSAFDFGLEEIELGDLTLTLTCGNKATLSGSLETLGLSLAVSGSDDKKDDITIPVKDEYIDIIEVVDIIRAAYLEAQKIIDAKDTEFTINATLTVDGVEMNITGYGEASWTDAGIRFAASLDMTIADTAKEQPNSETVHVNFVYDETEGNTLVRFTVNELGLEISRENITEVSDLFTEIMNTVKGLIGSGGQAAYYSEEAVEENVEENAGKGPAINYTKLLGTALDIISKITVELQEPAEEGSVKDLVVTYAGNGSLVLGANGGLSLDLAIADDEATEILSLKASVVSGDGSKIGAINSAMDEVDENGEKIYTFGTADTFIKSVYEYVLNLLDNLTVKNLLGSSTYTVEVALNGSESGIEALDGINVNATLYYTETDDKGAKLIEADVNLDIKGTAVIAKAYYTDRAVYISLENVGGTELIDVAFTAELDNIYGAAKTLVELIRSDALAEIISIFAGEQVQALSLDEVEGGAAEEGAADGNATEGGATSTSLTAVLNYILTLDINSVIKREHTDGKNVLTVTPDALLKALDVDVSIGTVKVEVNPETHSVYASVNNGNEWLTLNAVAVKNSEHATLNTDKFIDINFVSTLLEDLKATLESSVKDDGEILLSYTGEIRADVKYSVINTAITFKSTVLTVGLDKDGDFYLTLTASLDTNKAKIGSVNINLGNTTNVTTAGNISITYSNGLLTFGRDGVYKVMTLNYLLDNAMASGSPVQWLLGMGDTVWGILKSAIPLNLSSGLTTPQTIELYELAKADADNGVFNLASIFNAFAYGLGRDARGYKADSMTAASEKLGLDDNYYAFDVNGNLLTGGTIATLYAAILRDGDGIKGIKAFANVAGYVDLTVTLDSRAETDNANLYKEVKESEDIDLNYFDGAAKDEANHTTPIFGCYDMTKNGDERYIASQVLDTVILTVYDENGDAEEYDLSYGSTVYLTNTFAPDWANEDKTKTFVYKTSSHEVITEESIVITADTVIYKAVGETPKKEIIYHTNIVGLEEVSAALTVSGDKVKLEKYKADGYWLEGWYSDDKHENAISADDALSYGGKDVYCVYKKESVTVNGVVYSYIEEEQAYHVTGFDGGSILPYTEYNSVLMLENEIDGYAVTAIGEKAFEKANIKNIIVPENITKVASLAFLDNIDMRTAVFLAPEIAFEGSRGKNSENGYPFYGCTEEENGEYTNLSVYCNTVINQTIYSSDNVPDWAHVRTVNNNKYRFIGHNGGTQGSELSCNGIYRYNKNNDGNNRITSGNMWAYVTFDIVAENNSNSVSVSNIVFASLKNGINTAAMTMEEIETYVLGVLNGLTQADGYINAFTVSATGGIELNGKMYTVTVTVTEKPEEEWLRDTNVSVSLISEIAFGIDGTNLEANGNEYVLSITASDLIPDANPVNSSVTFLGWAKLNADGTLEFTEARANANATYYAIWANNNDGVRFNVNTSGTMPEINVTAGNKELDKWVDAKGNEVTRLIPDTTVLTVNLKDKSSGGCVATGTLITLADGSQKPVEDLEVGEMVLVWNFYTGAFDVAPVMYIDSDPDAYYEIINLCFSDGTQVKVIDKHGFWDFDLNKYIYLDADAAQYIGHWFNKQVTGTDEWVKVQLTDVIISTEYTGSWSPVTYKHLCYYVNGMLCVPGNNEPFIYIFDVDGEAMKYDEQAMLKDIETYGLYTYEEFYELMPVSEEVFEAYNGQYMKVALGKGLTDIESLEALAEIYKDLTDSL